VADGGAEPSGLDASEARIAHAQARLPEADLRVGEMEELPWDDDGFDLDTGFNSFFFANDIVAALREARRVAKPAGFGGDPGLGGTRALRFGGDEADRATVPAPASA
jgi:ubiquinone/menaquinone biosynthesis C-methylase UbiE